MAAYTDTDRTTLNSLLSNLKAVKGGFIKTTAGSGIMGGTRIKTTVRVPKLSNERKQVLGTLLTDHPEELGGYDVRTILNDTDLSIEAVERMIVAANKVIPKVEALLPLPVLQQDLPIDFVDIDGEPIDGREGEGEIPVFAATKEGETRIGDVVLTIPPEQISIIDYNTSTAIPIVRGLGTSTFLS